MPPVLLRSHAQGSLEALFTCIAHHDLRPDVAEDFVAVGSAVNDEMSWCIDLGA